MYIKDLKTKKVYMHGIGVKSTSYACKYNYYSYTACSYVARLHESLF